VYPTKRLEIKYNNSLKQTATRVTPFATEANPTPRYGGLVPPLGGSQSHSSVEQDKEKCQ